MKLKPNWYLRQKVASENTFFSFTIWLHYSPNSSTFSQGFYQFVTVLCQYNSQCLHTRTRVQRNGVEQQLGPGRLNEFESELLARALPELKAQIARGEEFAREHLGELNRRRARN